jgi:hypothetical protein
VCDEQEGIVSKSRGAFSFSVPAERLMLMHRSVYRYSRGVSFGCSCCSNHPTTARHLLGGAGRDKVPFTAVRFPFGVHFVLPWDVTWCGGRRTKEKVWDWRKVTARSYRVWHQSEHDHAVGSHLVPATVLSTSARTATSHSQRIGFNLHK